jgi:hypothetical protein
MNMKLSNAPLIDTHRKFRADLIILSDEKNYSSSSNAIVLIDVIEKESGFSTDKNTIAHSLKDVIDFYKAHAI